MNFLDFLGTLIGKQTNNKKTFTPWISIKACLSLGLPLILIGYVRVHMFKVISPPR
jgi:hypothetical protein